MYYIRTELEEAAGQYSDMFKDVYGFRPRHQMKDTVEAYQAAIDALYPEMLECIKEDERRSLAGQAEFFSRLRDISEKHGVSVLTATRWLFEAHLEDYYTDHGEQYYADQEFDCFLWHQSIPVGVGHVINKAYFASFPINPSIAA